MKELGQFCLDTLWSREHYSKKIVHLIIIWLEEMVSSHCVQHPEHFTSLDLSRSNQAIDYGSRILVKGCPGSATVTKWPRWWWLYRHYTGAPLISCENEVPWSPFFPNVNVLFTFLHNYCLTPRNRYRMHLDQGSQTQMTWSPGLLACLSQYCRYHFWVWQIHRVWLVVQW